MAHFPWRRRDRGADRACSPPGEGPLALELRWKRDLGSGYSGIAVAEGLLVTVFEAGERDVVAAFDPESGEERWRYDLAPEVPGARRLRQRRHGHPRHCRGTSLRSGPLGALGGSRREDRRVALDRPPRGRPGQQEAPVRLRLVAGGGGRHPRARYRRRGRGGRRLRRGDRRALRWRSVEDEIFSQSAVVADLAGRTAGAGPRRRSCCWAWIPPTAPCSGASSTVAISATSWGLSPSRPW